jgi:hypothetical protein
MGFASREDWPIFDIGLLDSQFKKEVQYEPQVS